MKPNRSEWIAIAAVLLFLAASVVYSFASRAGAGEVTISVQAAADADAVRSGNDTGGEVPDMSPSHYIDGRLDINAATADELMTLPGIGEVLASRILEARTEKGSFGSTEELLEVSGIGEATYAEIQDYITVGGTK